MHTKSPFTSKTINPLNFSDLYRVSPQQALASLKQTSSSAIPKKYKNIPSPSKRAQHPDLLSLAKCSCKLEGRSLTVSDLIVVQQKEKKNCEKKKKRETSIHLPKLDPRNSSAVSWMYKSFGIYIFLIAYYVWVKVASSVLFARCLLFNRDNRAISIKKKKLYCCNHPSLECSTT